MALHGMNIIAGAPTASAAGTSQAIDPSTDEPLPGDFQHATSDLLDQAVRAAEGATREVAALPAERRASLLARMAEEILAVGDELITRCKHETALPEGRLVSERGRTMNQLRMFADLVADGSWVDARIDTAIPDRAPIPKPDLRRMLMPIGAVGVFCASNFPLAFSVAGGDTASAIAAGCGVVIKAHSSHPGTAELVATALSAAVEKEGMPPGLISLIHGPGRTVGTQLVVHSLIRAAGFTGSQAGGRALFDAASSRPDPIPVYAEMGSINPVFVLPGALRERGAEIAEGLKNSVTLGVGQFCTNPGLVVGLSSPDLTRFVETSGTLIRESPAETMLNAGIHAAYIDGVHRLEQTGGVRRASDSIGSSAGNAGAPAVFATDAGVFLSNDALSEEVFGPSTLVVEGNSVEELVRIAESMEGHLTATIHGTETELEEYATLIEVLRRKVGRLIFNGFPTGVEVCPSMNHGGPWPAATDVHYTSVGTAAIDRFSRPICYQGFPDSALPPELQNANPRGIMRLINGQLTRNAV